MQFSFNFKLVATLNEEEAKMLDSTETVLHEIPNVMLKIYLLEISRIYTMGGLFFILIFGGISTNIKVI